LIELVYLCGDVKTPGEKKVKRSEEEVVVAAASGVLLPAIK
jgi:hypothetical protein